MTPLTKGLPLVKKKFTKRSEIAKANTLALEAGHKYADMVEILPIQYHVKKADLPPGTYRKVTGNEATAIGFVAAACLANKTLFYGSYPITPASDILHELALHKHYRVKTFQAEDEIAAIGAAIGASFGGEIGICGTSGPGLCLKSEALNLAIVAELPLVVANIQRAGPSTGMPTKTEQGDLWEALGASQGDYQRFIVAPRDALDAFNTMPELFNLVDKFQCPGIVLSDLLIAEGRFSFDPDDVDMHPKIDRGALITEPSTTNGYMRYKNTENGISPRALPGLEGYAHVVATDEHDEDSKLLSDEFTNPHKRQMMVEKRARKFRDVSSEVAPPHLEGPEDADVTLIGWGSTYGVIKEAIEQLTDQGVSVNHLSIKWIVPFHGDAVTEILSHAKRTIIVENNYSGQFYRYMRGETGISVDGHIRKYDGEPFMPHHIVNGVLEQMAGNTDVYVPVHEIIV